MFPAAKRRGVDSALKLRVYYYNFTGLCSIRNYAEAKVQTKKAEELRGFEGGKGAGEKTEHKSEERLHKSAAAGR